jgi:hypothetical protein
VTLSSVAERAEAVIERSPQPYENAITLVELAEAYARVGEADRAAEFRERAAALAAAGGFYEVSHRAENLVVAPRRPNGPASRRPALGVDARSVVESLESLENGTAAFVAAESGPSRSPER